MNKMDFIKTEEKLISVQLDVVDTLKKKEFLSKVDNFINDNSVSKNTETVDCTIKVPESLGKFSDLIMPLRIKGKMLGIGKHKKRYYTEEALKWSIMFHSGKKFPVKLDHRDKEVASTIGAVDRIYWDDVEKVIRYEAHINDETHARNLIDGVVPGVSATVQAIEQFDNTHGVVGIEPEYDELSLVYGGGAYKGNSIEVVE